MAHTLRDHPTVIALAGDWHGNLGWARRMLSIAHNAGAEVLVQLGDFGYWRDDPATRKYLDRLEKQLTELDLQLYWVDGNHEDHERLQKQPLAGDGTRPISDHITHLPRGHRRTWHDDTGQPHVWLALGGAVSVDRDERTPGRSWWPEEQITQSDIDTATAGGPVDVMLAHDAPAGVPTPGISDEGWPVDALRDSARHRDVLRGVLDTLRPRHLWHGHYHVRYDAGLDWSDNLFASKGETRVHGLDRDDTHWARNLALVDPAGQQLPWPDLE